MTRRAVIYCRLSPTPRSEESKGGNLDQQESKSREKCEREGWEVVEVVVDRDTSASKGKRPGWGRVVDLIERGEVDTVVSRHVDRMYRQPRELEDLIDLSDATGVTLAAALVDRGGIDLTTPNGRAFARIGATLARQEIEQKSERQRLGHERRADAGRPWWTSRPFGFERDGQHRETEAIALRQAYADLLAGQSLYAIAERLNREGHLSPRAGTERAHRDGTSTVDTGRWRSSNLRAVLKNPRNAAIHTYRGQPTGVEAQWEPIVSREVYDAAVRLLASPERRPSDNGGKRLGLLTNLAECGKVLSGNAARRRYVEDGTVCAGKMIRTLARPRKDGSREVMYRCRECQGVSIPADFADSYVMRQMIEKAEAWVDQLDPADDEQTQTEVTELRAEHSRLEARKRELAELFADELIDRQGLTAGVERANARLSELTQRIADLTVSKVSRSAMASDTEYLFAVFDRIEQTGEQDRLRAIFTMMAERIVCLPRGRGARRPRAEDVRIDWRTRRTA